VLDTHLWHVNKYKTISRIDTHYKGRAVMSFCCLY